MFSLCVLVLTLLVSAVQAFPSSGCERNLTPELSAEELNALYNSLVYEAERVYRPMASRSSSSSSCSFPLGMSHSGVKVTVEDAVSGRRSQWLIHKGQGYGIKSNTVVVNAGHMIGEWQRQNI